MLHVFIRTINILLDILVMIIAIRAIVSWIPIPKESAFLKILYKITDPMLEPIRKLIQRSAFGQNMMVDFSPVILILIIYILRGILNKL